MKQPAEIIAALATILAVHIVYSWAVGYSYVIVLPSGLFCLGILLIHRLLIGPQSKNEVLTKSKNPSITSEVETIKTTPGDQSTLVINQTELNRGDDRDK